MGPAPVSAEAADSADRLGVRVADIEWLRRTLERLDGIAAAKRLDADARADIEAERERVVAMLHALGVDL